MPAQSTSGADKKQLAQQARRKAALNSGKTRRARTRAAVQTAASAPAQSGAAVSNTNVNTDISADTRSESLFGAQEVAVSNSVSEAISASIDNDASEELDALCEIVDSNPTALGSDLSNARQICRNRRKALSTRGKAAVPGKNSSSRRGSGAARAMAYAAGQINGRDVAKLRRQEMASRGRGDEPASRPSGRVKPGLVPPKVETGTTLAGHEVSGTQVERTTSVTGNESGTCRSITGTEYVGTEQFATFCDTQPEPNPPKVGVSLTGTGEAVTGTEVGRASNVTGDEQGSCASVTGSEYIGAEKLEGFCNTKPSPRPAKVMSGRTEKKDIRLTGSDEARMNATTGAEAGSQQLVTGSQYADAGAAKLTINGPEKVALTHTIAGQAVTGTEVGRSASVTGDEYGSCRPVTGTEYISNEQFASVCGTIAEPHPAKVGVDNSSRGQRVTGVMLNRVENVTGNEAGACSQLTGSQYGQSNVCGGVAPKVNDMHTLNGGNLTGNSVDISPKMTGDEQGGCSPVTGTEYYGQEQYSQCPSTPQAAPAKVGFDHTPKGEHVSGTMVGAVGSVTGNEHGAQLPVSGSPYVGAKAPEGHGSCCDACAVKDAAVAAGLVAQVQAPQVPQGYVQQAQVQQVVTAPVQQIMAVNAPEDFSIMSPARSAQVTGNNFGGNRITGPGDLANNRVSGTPEFRYPQNQMVAPASPAPAMVAPAPPHPQAVFAVAEQAHAVQAQAVGSSSIDTRITGEGREGGVSVSGDNWGRVPGMTGTEGHVAQGRNPSLRMGEMQQPVNNAHHNKEMERPDAPEARVTGSSGNTHEGAVITVSGGARG